MSKLFIALNYKNETELSEDSYMYKKFYKVPNNTTMRICLNAQQVLVEFYRPLIPFMQSIKPVIDFMKWIWPKAENPEYYSEEDIEESEVCIECLNKRPVLYKIQDYTKILTDRFTE